MALRQRMGDGVINLRLCRPLVRIQSGVPKTVSNDTFETVFTYGKLRELKPDLTTIAHFAIKLSYYAMSYLQHPLQARAGGLFVFVEGVGVDVQRGGGLAVAEDAHHRGHIRAARDHQTGGGKAITIFLGK